MEVLLIKCSSACLQHVRQDVSLAVFRFHCLDVQLNSSSDQCLCESLPDQGPVRTKAWLLQGPAGCVRGGPVQKSGVGYRPEEEKCGIWTSPSLGGESH